MAIEQAGGVTLDGRPLTLMGPQIKVGDKAPNFSVIATDYSEVTLRTDVGKHRLILSLPSLDTPVCDAEAKRFNDMAARFPEQVVIYAISCDLPTALNRWCATTQAERIRALSDHRTLSFGDAYGTHIKEIRQLSRAVFLIDADDVVQYVEYVPEVGSQPDYEAASAAVDKLQS